ncbi:hypothetical protein GCM10009102_26060 [Sphingomonas insulae]|uniref:Uncharacterized protein n=1 Tax=Sphingomonas insulae TaxID=424800 RepID=A0ABP3T388_9SPHN
MGTFRFHLMGARQPIDLEVAASTIGDLDEMLSCRRFVEGRLVEPDSDGVLRGMLIATSRIECVVDAD